MPQISGERADPERPRRSIGSVTRPRRRAAAAAQQLNGGVADHRRRRPAAQPSTGGRFLLPIARITVVADRDVLAAPRAASSTTPWKARNAASVTTKDGMPILATRKPSTRPITVPVTSAASTATYQGQPCSASSDRQHRGADAAGEAGGQVDLAEQQHEDQAHRDHDDRRALGEQVGEVAGGEEAPAARCAKTMQSTTRPSDGRQRADVAAAHPLPGSRGRGWPAWAAGRGPARARCGPWSCSSVRSVRVMSMMPSARSRCRRRCRRAGPSSPLRPAVISSTTWAWVTSVVCDLGRPSGRGRARRCGRRPRRRRSCCAR